MADVSVRVAWASDAAALADIQARAWREQFPAEAAEAVAPDGALEDLAAGWQAWLQSPGDARNRVLVALEGPTVRGFALTAASPDPDADRVADGLVAEFTVDPDHRGRGHGSRLLQACVDTLQADRFTRATTWVRSTDDALRGFLADAGWGPDGASRELASPDGARVREVRLHTDIGSPPRA